MRQPKPIDMLFVIPALIVLGVILIIKMYAIAFWALGVAIASWVGRLIESNDVV